MKKGGRGRGGRGGGVILCTCICQRDASVNGSQSGLLVHRGSCITLAPSSRLAYLLWAPNSQLLTDTWDQNCSKHRPQHKYASCDEGTIVASTAHTPLLHSTFFLLWITKNVNSLCELQWLPVQRSILESETELLGTMHGIPWQT